MEGSLEYLNNIINYNFDNTTCKVLKLVFNKFMIHVYGEEKENNVDNEDSKSE